MSDLEQETKPTAWKSMGSAPKDGRWILVRSMTATLPRYWAVETGRWQNGEPWLSTGNARRHPNGFDAWTDIPS